MMFVKVMTGPWCVNARKSGECVPPLDVSKDTNVVALLVPGASAMVWAMHVEMPCAKACESSRTVTVALP